MTTPPAAQLLHREWGVADHPAASSCIATRLRNLCEPADGVHRRQAKGTKHTQNPATQQQHAQQILELDTRTVTMHTGPDRPAADMSAIIVVPGSVLGAPWHAVRVAVRYSSELQNEAAQFAKIVCHRSSC
jgi:hypothetical protein